MLFLMTWRDNNAFIYPQFDGWIRSSLSERHNLVVSGGKTILNTTTIEGRMKVHSKIQKSYTGV